MPRPTSVPSKRYSPEERRTALAAFALTSGNEEKTSALLKENGYSIPYGTIKSWTSRHKDEYRQIRNDVMDHSRVMLADANRDLAHSYIELENVALTDLKGALKEEDVSAKELASIAKNLAVGRGISIDKAERLDDRPTVVVEHDFTDIKQTLKAAGIQLIEPIDAEAIEIDALPA